MKKLRLTYANVMSTIAVFLGLGGVSYAAFTIPPNSVGTTQIRERSITATKLAKESVRADRLDPNLRSALNLTDNVGRTVRSSSGETLGVLVKEWKGYGSGLSLPQEAFSIRRADGRVIERVVSTGDTAFASGNVLREFAYKTADCTGAAYVSGGSRNYADVWRKLPRSEPLRSSPDGPSGPSSPFGKSYEPIDANATPETFRPSSARVFGGQMYTFFDGSCFRFDSLSGEDSIGTMTSFWSDADTEPDQLPPLFKVTLRTPIGGTLVGPLKLG